MDDPESGSGGQGGDPSDEDWRSKRKHVFVLSEAGKPIYSRYGSVEALSTTMGVMTALVSFVQSAGDAIRAIYAGKQRGGRLNKTVTGNMDLVGLQAVGLSVWVPGSLSSQPGVDQWVWMDSQMFEEGQWGLCPSVWSSGF